MSGPVEHVLKEPLVRRKADTGEIVEELTIRTLQLRTDIRARDLKAMDSATGEIGRLVALIAQLSGLSVAQVDDMGAVDFLTVGELVGGFMPPGLLTGEIV